MSKDDVHGVNGIGADRFLQVHWLGLDAPRQDFVQHVPADQRHELNGDFKRAVFPAVTWQSDIKVNLKKKVKLNFCLTEVGGLQTKRQASKLQCMDLPHRWQQEAG